MSNFERYSYPFVHFVRRGDEIDNSVYHDIRFLFDPILPCHREGGATAGLNGKIVKTGIVILAECFPVPHCRKDMLNFVFAFLKVVLAAFDQLAVENDVRDPRVRLLRGVPSIGIGFPDYSSCS